jgi:hypothetical protein
MTVHYIKIGHYCSIKFFSYEAVSIYDTLSVKFDPIHTLCLNECFPTTKSVLSVKCLEIMVYDVRF